MKISNIQEIIEELKQNKPVIIVDDENRENEGDLVMPARTIDSNWINFMTKYGRGLICVSLTADYAQHFDLSPMTKRNTDPNGTAFTVSIDYKTNSTGISAFDRADTIKALLDKNATAQDFRRPGHIFPLISKDGGVLRRAGHTEAAVDLARLAGFESVGVICEIMDNDGTMMRLPELLKFAKIHNLKIGTIENLISYRMQNDPFISKEGEAILPTQYGEFKIIGFLDKISGAEHIALTMGEIENNLEPILIRVHSECLTGDAFHSLRCDCGPQLDAAMKRISEEKRGIIVYLKQEGRGIGLLNKIKAYNLQDQGFDTVEANLKLGFAADQRDFGIGAQILHLLGARKLKVMTNNPKKLHSLNGFNLEIIERVPLIVGENIKNEKYLETKRKKMGHLSQ